MTYDVIKISGIPEITTPSESTDIVLGDGNYLKRIKYNTVKADMVGTSPSYTTDTEPYLMRQTAHTGVVGKCALNKLVGGSLGWNQLAQGNTVNTTINGVSFVRSTAETAMTINGTATATATWFNSTTASIIQGHVYLLIGAPNNKIFTNMTGVSLWNNTNLTDVGSGGLMRATGSGNSTLAVTVTSGTTASNVNISPQLFDITAMFGSTIADYVLSLGVSNGIAWLSQYIDLGTYHAYDAGSIQSVQATAHVTTGKNQYTQGNAQGAIYGGGTEDASATRCKTDGYIPVVANQKYTIKTFTTGIYVIGYAFYDRQQNFIQTVTPSSNTNYTNTFTSLGNASYVRFTFWKQNNNITPSEIGNVQLELGETATAYESPVIHTYPLGSDTLRGVPQLVSNKLAFDGDEKYPDGTIKRKYKIVTYNGSENWVSDATTAYAYRYYVADDTVKRYTNYINHMIANIPIIATYNPQSAVSEPLSVTAYTYTSNPNNNWVYMVASASGDIDTVAKLKTYLSAHPVTVVLPLATESTESSTAYQKVQTIDANGTESFTTSSPVPVGHETQTPDNVLAALGWLGE